MALPTPREPTLDPAEPISPELVLVAPELREPALGRSRRLPPTAPPTATASTGGPARIETVGGRRRLHRRAIGFAAGAAVIVAAVALVPRTHDAPTLEPLARQRGGDRVPAPTTTHAVTPTRARRAKRPTTTRTNRRAKSSHSTTGRPKGEQARTAATERKETRVSRPKRKRARTAASDRKRTSGSRPKRERTPTAQPGREQTTSARRAAERLARQAERDVLGSPAFFIRLGVGGRPFVDPATRLFRSGVSIRCTAAPGATRLPCVVRRGSVSLAVLYLRTSRHSFRLARP